MTGLIIIIVTLAAVLTVLVVNERMVRETELVRKKVEESARTIQRLNILCQLYPEMLVAINHRLAAGEFGDPRNMLAVRTAMDTFLEMCRCELMLDTGKDLL